jgi:uncharacterized protein YjbJ (UPF0337 family)
MIDRRIRWIRAKLSTAAKALLLGRARRKVRTVGADDKIENRADVLKGKVKETAGRATDDPELEAEGRGDQVKGNIKQAGEKVKDAVKDVLGKQ